MTAADPLGMTIKVLRREIEDGPIVAVSTGLGHRVTREEMIAAAMRVWEHGVIEEALGDDAAAVLPEAIRLVESKACVPRYQREMLRYLARRDGTTVDEVLTRELEDVAYAHSEKLAAAVPGLETALGWPESAIVRQPENSEQRIEQCDGTRHNRVSIASRCHRAGGAGRAGRAS